LRGARQVGKTTAVEIFAREFDNFIELNLEKKTDFDFFERDLPVRELVDAILLSKNISLKKGRTLIFIDEIQNSHKAVAILRYFYESTPEYHIIAAGSLLEIMMTKHDIGFPVGRVEYRFMYPLTFHEYLQAMGLEQAVKYYTTLPCPDMAIETLKDLFHKYSMVGGMPEIVAKYSEEENVAALSLLYQSLITSFQDDVKKYAHSDTMVEVISHAIESAPLEAGNRIKFHGFGNSNYRSREMGDALRNLQRAMLVYLVYPITGVEPPALPNKRKSPRLQFIDTGLLAYGAGIQSLFYENKDLHSIYNGKIVEHIAGQEIIARNGQSPDSYNFWVKEKKQSNSEIDFIVQYRDKFIPVEVKAGATGTLRSLHQFMNEADHVYAVRMYSGKLSVDTVQTTDGKKFFLLNLPYCFAGRLYEYIAWFVEGH